MNTAHLTDMQLQSYTDGLEPMGGEAKEHIAQCVHCQVRLENHRLIHGALKAIPAPAFDFDFADEVLASVRPQKSKVSWTPLLATVAGVLLLILFPFPYTLQIAGWFSALPKEWGYVLTLPAVVFLLVHIMLTVAEHQRKMNMLLGK